MTAYYLTRDDRDPDGYATHLDPGVAQAIAMRAARCDECAGPLAPFERVIVQHRSALDHDTHYLTVVHRFPCLAVVAERFG